MSKPKEFKNSSLYLLEMQGACKKITAYLQRTNKADFLKCLESYDAICMQFSHLGEQVSLLEKHPDKIISHFPDEIDWPAIKALRNRIDHAYTTIDANMIWKFANEETTGIESALSRILKKRYGL